MSKKHQNLRRHKRHRQGEDKPNARTRYDHCEALAAELVKRGLASPNILEARITGWSK